MNAVAASDGQRTAIVTAGAEYTYRELAELVSDRSDELAGSVDPGDVVPVPVALDVASIINILAVTDAGGVVLPYIGNPPPVADRAPDGDAYIIPTSGSTGEPRLVRITGANIHHSVVASRARLGTSANDRWLLCLPLNHVAGLSIVWRSLHAGGSVAVAPFSDGIGEFVHTARPTVASLVPTMVVRMIDRNIEALAGLRFVLVGGGALASSVRDAASAGGVVAVPTYGMTEATSQVATAEVGVPGEPRALDGVEISILDSDGRDVPDGAVGRIAIEGPSVSPGYLGEPSRTGRLLTSDVGRLDATGVLEVMGRVDDIVVSGGENVSLDHIAAVASTIDGVHDAVALGVEDTEWGTAVVVVATTNLGEQALVAAAREVLPPHQRPRRWVTVAQLPLLSNGKVDRVAVRTIAGID